MAPRMVWSLSHGSYSDYGVLALFTTKELAEAHLAQWKKAEGDYSEAHVEEFWLLDELPTKAVVYFAQAFFRKHGNTDASDTPHRSERYDYAGVATRTRPLVEVEDDGDGWTRINVTGSDADHVMKALHDRMAQVKAQRAGIA